MWTALRDKTNCIIQNINGYGGHFHIAHGTRVNFWNDFRLSNGFNGHFSWLHRRSETYSCHFTINNAFIAFYLVKTELNVLDDKNQTTLVASAATTNSSKSVGKKWTPNDHFQKILQQLILYNIHIHMCARQGGKSSCWNELATIPPPQSLHTANGNRIVSAIWPTKATTENNTTVSSERWRKKKTEHLIWTGFVYAYGNCPPRLGSYINKWHIMISIASCIHIYMRFLSVTHYTNDVSLWTLCDRTYQSHTNRF